MRVVFSNGLVYGTGEEWYHILRCSCAVGTTTNVCFLLRGCSGVIDVEAHIYVSYIIHIIYNVMLHDVGVATILYTW